MGGVQSLLAGPLNIIRRGFGGVTEAKGQVDDNDNNDNKTFRISQGIRDGGDQAKRGATSNGEAVEVVQPIFRAEQRRMEQGALRNPFAKMTKGKKAMQNNGNRPDGRSSSSSRGVTAFAQGETQPTATDNTANDNKGNVITFKPTRDFKGELIQYSLLSEDDFNEQFDAWFEALTAPPPALGTQRHLRLASEQNEQRTTHQLNRTSEITGKLRRRPTLPKTKGSTVDAGPADSSGSTASRSTYTGVAATAEVLTPCSSTFFGSLSNGGASASSKVTSASPSSSSVPASSAPASQLPSSKTTFRVRLPEAWVATPGTEVDQRRLDRSSDNTGNSPAQPSGGCSSKVERQRDVKMPETVEWIDAQAIKLEDTGLMARRVRLSWCDGTRFYGHLALNEGDWQGVGFGVVTWKDGRRYEGEFVEGLPHGEGLLVHPEHGRFEGRFVRGKPMMRRAAEVFTPE